MTDTHSLICPHCKNPLVATQDRRYICEQSHSHDLSKEGYLNLLPVNKKKSKLPGDNDLMIAARRAFLEEGHYDPLINQIQEILATHIDVSASILNILDAGCGEGYYSQKALNIPTKSKMNIIGTDISKYAIKLAAKRYRDRFFFVSSVYDLPVSSHIIDVILSVFAPIHPKEFNRVLAPEGIVIIISAGPNHLKELAELIYATFRPHDNKVANKMSPLFELKHQRNHRYELILNKNESIINLLKMTPYYWNISKEMLAKFHEFKELTLTCDFDIQVFQLAE